MIGADGTRLYSPPTPKDLPFATTGALSHDEYLRFMAETPREEWSTLSWQLESGVDAVAERGWKWWSVAVVGHNARIALAVVRVPGRTFAFKQILLAAGATILAERYE